MMMELTPLFHTLLCENTEIEDIPKGEILVKEGEICKYIFFIETGQIRHFYERNGKTINVHFAFERQYTTNLKSFLFDQPSEYFIQASETTLLRRLDKSQIEGIFENNDATEAFNNHLMQLLISQEEHSHLFKIYNSAERYHYVARNNPRLLQRVSLSQLSTYLGISRETISRIRRNAMYFN